MKDESICCHGKCLEDLPCPYRSAVTPKDELPAPKRDVVFEALCWVAGVVTVAAVVVGVAL